MILDPRLRSGRLVLALFVILLLGIGACSIPSSYEQEVGMSLQIRMDPSSLKSGSDMDALLTALKQVPGVQKVSAMMPGCEEVTQADIMLWGEDIDEYTVQALITEQFPEMAAAISIAPLAGSVECNLGGKVLHDLFQIEVEGTDPEAIRQQILTQLAAEGHENAEVAVQVNEEDGQARIQIKISEEEQQ